MLIYKANDAASPTPVSDGKNVFAFFAELGLISYGPDGKERWRVPLGPFHSFYGMGGSPILIGNTLVMVCDQRTDSFIVAIDTRSGKELWRKSRPNYEAYSTPAIYKPRNGPSQVIVLGSNSVDGYSLDKGERLWWVTRIGSYPKGVPVVGTGMVYVTGDGGEQPFLPPFDETLKQFDADKDQRVKRDEMKSQAEALDHFGWLDANNDGYIERTEWDFVRNSTNGRAHFRSGRPHVVERCVACSKGLSKHTGAVDVSRRDLPDERGRNRFQPGSGERTSSQTRPNAGCARGVLRIACRRRRQGLRRQCERQGDCT
jgi:outer membrane protein assembly factor BamB